MPHRWSRACRDAPKKVSVPVASPLPSLQVFPGRHECTTLARSHAQEQARNVGMSSISRQIMYGLERGGATTWAGLALVAATLAEYLASRPAAALGEVPADIICWLLLPQLFAAANLGRIPMPVWNKWRVDDGIRDSEQLGLVEKKGLGPASSSLALWVSAGSLVAVCLYRAEVGAVGLFVSHCDANLLGAGGRLSRWNGQLG